ncbi:MAG: TlpA disulfide reductase family protein [Acidobacteriota bacterium]
MPDTLRLAGLLFSLLLFAAAADAQDKATYKIAKTSKEVTRDEAQELLNTGNYQMTQIDENGLSTVLLYQETSDLEDHMPPHILEVMRQRDAGEAPGPEWIGKDLPEFSGTDEQGRTVSSADLRGKVVVVNYWFIACKPCVREMPALSKVQRRYAERDDVEFVAITFDGAEEVADFLADREFTYRRMTLPQEWFGKSGIFTYPLHMVVGRDGVVRGEIEGLGSTEELERELNHLIDEALAGDDD